MNERNEILTAMQSRIDALGGAVFIMPTALAFATYTAISPSQDDDRLVAYLSVEALKDMARKLLAKKFDTESNETEAYQGELFSGKLQNRYPIPRARGDEPVYKLRSELTPEERRWNANQLRKSASTRLEHADALEAEGMVGSSGGAA